MKILFLNCSDYGSTGKIIGDICQNLSDKISDFQALLCTPVIKGEDYKGLKKIKTSVKLEQGLYRRLNYIFGMRYGFAPLSTIKIKRIIKKFSPDIVNIHCVNGYTVNVYSILKYLKKNNIPTVITNHAEFFYTGNCPYAFDCEKWQTGCGNCPNLFFASDSKIFDRTHTAWLKMKNAISGNDKLRVVSVSPWVLSRSMQSPIMENVKQKCIMNGLNTHIFTPLDSRKHICQKLGIDEACKIILQVTAYFSSDDKKMKGGFYFNELAKRFENENVCFVVVGRTIENPQLPNLKMVGSVLDQKELAAYYSAADLTVLTSRKETFGMAVAESLCCGTPVIGFKAGGSESVAIDEFSDFVEFSHLDDLEKIIREKWLDYKTLEKVDFISDTAKKKYASSVMAEGYLETYNELLK
ncbi:MAG: glycosyltransferase [Ruminococcaceae bacterium]|nr:glycosyltransferase [Oscillospiraceae bacterium]